MKFGKSGLRIAASDRSFAPSATRSRSGFTSRKQEESQATGSVASLTPPVGALRISKALTLRLCKDCAQYYKGRSKIP